MERSENERMINNVKKANNFPEDNNDPLSIKSNLGSIESSIKKNKSEIGKIIKKETMTNNSEVIEWEAVYIENKFYLTDKQTVQRYYEIQSLLEKEKQSKTSVMKNIESERITDLEMNRIQNLETIKLVDLSQNEKEKQEDESLLNHFNLSTSLSFSRFTLNNESEDKSKEQKSLEIQEKCEDKIEMENLRNSHLFNEPSAMEEQKSLEGKNQQSYYLAANNTKVYSKKKSHSNIEALESYPNQEKSAIENELKRLKITSPLSSLKSNMSMKIHRISEEYDKGLPKAERKSHPILSSNKKMSSLQVEKVKNTSIFSSLTQRELPKTSLKESFSLSKRKISRTFCKSRHQQSFDMKNNFLKQKKKYELPEIIGSDKKPNRSQFVGEDYKNVEKLHESKFFEQAEEKMLESSSKFKNRLNGFIKNVSQKHIEILEMTKNRRNQSIEVFEEESFSQKKLKNSHEESELINENSNILNSNSNNELKIESNQKAKKDVSVVANLNPEIFELTMKKDELLIKLSNLEKNELQSEIEEIKEELREIEIKRLNKMSKTIDLSENSKNSKNEISENLKSWNEKLENFPEELLKIKKPFDIGNLKVPQQLLKPTEGYKISATMTPEELQKVAISVYKLFGIEYDPEYRPSSLLTTSEKPELSFKKKERLVIKKFKNCVFFDIIDGYKTKNMNKTILWTFQDLKEKGHSKNFYIGGWSEFVEFEKDFSKINLKKFEKGVKNGYGLEINEKYIYEGQYFNGKKHGIGKLEIISSGYRYEGQFIENLQSGHGKEYQTLKKEIYVGEFYKGKRHGKGFLKKLRIQENSLKTKEKNNKFPYYFEGIFSNGKKESGRELFETGDEYKGEYLSEKFHGKGIFKWANGSQYEGEFYENNRHGFGKWESAADLVTGEKNFYIGEFKNNLKHGEGKYIYKNGSYYQGCFENDLKHGHGALFYQDKNGEEKILRGIWKEGNIEANEKGEIFKMRLEKEEIKFE